MPQLNFADYTPQLFWLAVTFILLYILMSRVALPRVARVLEARERKVSEDLARAEKLKAEADEALAAYNKALTDARSQAQAALQQASAAAAAEQAQRDAAFAATLHERTRAAEERIAAAKHAALADIRTVALDSATAMAGKLVGGLPQADIAAAVDAALGERR
jgi:F-type H+-transporting ATPase subunit b